MPIYRDTPTPNIISDNKKYFDENIRSLSERQVSWLQAYLADKTKDVSFISVGSTNLHEELINKLVKIDSFKQVFYDAHLRMLNSLVPDKYFKLIEESLRAQIFILQVLSDEYNYNGGKIQTDHILKLIYNFFDRKENENTAENKIIFLTNILSRFEEIFLNSNYNKWLNDNEERQLEWAANYLVEKELIVNVSNLENSKVELKAIVLSSLDLIDYPSRIEVGNRSYSYKISTNKEIIIDKMKRAWSQQKFRDAGKTKKPYHLPLTKNTKARLKKMAQVQGLSETAMLDILINRFYELDYVDVDGKDLY